ncbi:MAG: TlpA family protein disulfide reductase [Chloroflexota bacterium]|nr:TlpA family protein disulfide reductase [Chloroflexota bacterium]
MVGRSQLLDRPAPDFSLSDLDGRPTRLADYRGRPVIVNFWASWCVPCRTEFELFRDARTAHGGERLEILGVIYQDSPEAARRFVAQRHAAWPALVDPGGAVAAAYGVLGIPISFYLDRDGIVRAVSYGPPPSNVLDEQLDKIL